MMLCLSHKSMLKLIDRINESHDQLPLAWKDNLLPHIQVSYSVYASA